MAHPSSSRAWSLAIAGLGLAAGGANAQWFTDNPGDIPGGDPFNNSRTENVDFGDVEQDGDWDAIFADGGDFDQDQNRIWIKDRKSVV